MKMDFINYLSRIYLPNHSFLILIFILAIGIGSSLPDSMKETLQILTESRPNMCQEFADYGDTVDVHYMGMLENGEIFDSTTSRKVSPMKFVLGSANLIKGFEKGIYGMCIGETRKLVVPPSLGYGSHGIKGYVPGEARLLFSVQMIGIEKFSWIPHSDKVLGFGFALFSVVFVLNYLWTLLTQVKYNDKKAEKRHGKKKR